MEIKPHAFALPFIRKEQVSKDAFAFYFDRTKHPFDFLPGHYLRMILPHANPDERGSSHFFSIASSPLEKDHIRIVTRIIQSTFKHTLASLESGIDVQFFGPTGRFVLEASETKPVVLLAGGIGITPYLSMIPYAASKNMTIPITLLVSFSTSDDIIGLDELTAATKGHDNIRLVYTITKPEQSEKPWSGEIGRISTDMIKKHVPNLSDQTYYIVGPPVMVSAMEQMIKEAGIPDEQIKIENFSGY